MATIYLRSTDGSDASDGLTWANAKATMAAALTAAGAGGTVYKADGHAESQATTITLTSPGAAATPIPVLCVDDTSDPEPPTALATGGSVQVTAAGLQHLKFAGFGYDYGSTYIVGSAGNNNVQDIRWDSSAPWWWKHENCTFTLENINASSRVTVGLEISAGTVDDTLLEWVDCTVNFSSASQGFLVSTNFTWRGGSVGDTAPTVLFKAKSNTGNAGNVLVEGVDLSLLGSGSSLVDVSGATIGSFTFKNCKLGASVAFTTGTHAGQGGLTVEVVNCDSGDTNYNYYKRCYQGEIFDETAIVRTGGASDGTTALSHRFVSSANTKFYAPLVGPWVSFWNETTGSAITVATEVLWFGAALLKDDEAWIEVEYLGTSGFPVSSFAHDRAADILTAGANQSASTEPWVGTDRANNNLYSLNDIIEVQGRLWICTTAGSSDSSEPAGYASGSDGSSVNDGGAVFRAGYRLTLSKAVTPQEKGVIRARVCLAKASTTLYACPHLEVS